MVLSELLQIERKTFLPHVVIYGFYTLDQLVNIDRDFLWGCSRQLVSPLTFVMV